MCGVPQNINSRVAVALGLIAVGVMAFMGPGLLWPMFILVPGLVLLGIAFGGGRAGAAAMSIPAMIVTGTGALLFIQNLTGYWESWAYAWTLFGVFLGMGFMLMGQRLDDPSLHRVGRGFVQVSLMAFAAFAFFFEVIIGISGGPGPVGALILIGLGLFLLARNREGQRSLLALDPHSEKAKRKSKPKRHEDKLFTGPIVYGSRAPARDFSRLNSPEPDRAPVQSSDDEA
jgi:hypothetical protein